MLILVLIKIFFDLKGKRVIGCKERWCYDCMMVRRDGMGSR